MPKNLWRLMKAQTSGGRSRHSQLIFQSSSMRAELVDRAVEEGLLLGRQRRRREASSFDQSGLPVKRSASHQTSPASSASRSVSDIAGNTPRAQEKIGLVMKSRRKELMTMSLRVGATARCGNYTYANGLLTLAKCVSFG